MFQIHIDAIGENGLDLDRVMAADQFPLLHRFCQEAQTSFPRPVHARLHAMRSGDTVTLSGHITTAINVSCSRCLTEFDLAVDVSFSTTAIPGEADDLAAASPAEMELAETEMDLITYRGATIELCDEVASRSLWPCPSIRFAGRIAKAFAARAAAIATKPHAPAGIVIRPTRLPSSNNYPFPKKKRSRHVSASDRQRSVPPATDGRSPREGTIHRAPRKARPGGAQTRPGQNRTRSGASNAGRPPRPLISHRVVSAQCRHPRPAALEG